MKKLEVEIEGDLPCEYINAVRPDDMDLPEGMEIRHVCEGGRWKIYVSYEIEQPEDVLTLKNTLDDIVRSLQLIEKTIR
ncbi:MAG: KEOPS complex subunit Pcc1 [Pyrobaculum sp.]